jgi:hypothetical protein
MPIRPMSTLNWRMKSIVALADDAAVARADDAAGDDHLAVRVVGKDRGDVQVVGDHAQPLVMQQLVSDRFGGGADVDDQRAPRRHRRPPRRGRSAVWPCG